MGTLTTAVLTNTANNVTVPVRELTARVIQRYVADYTGGEWNPDNNNNWVPGSWVDFTPKRSDSRISYTWRAPHAWIGQTHAISHWRFYVNGNLYFWNSTSGRHIEDGCVMKWDVPSWGTTAGRIGYQIRAYSNDNHEIRMYTTYYWDGTGRSAQNCKGQLIVEEYAGVSQAVGVQAETFTAR